MKELASQEVIDDLQDIHNGLHIAMDKLITDENYRDAELVLRQVDARMVRLINSVSRALNG